MSNGLKSLALTGLFLGLFVGASSAQDECATATATGEATGIALDTSMATTDAVPSSCGLSAPDVWLAYTAGCTGTATIETTSGPGGDTILEVMDGCGGTVLACDDDGGAGFLSLINLSVTSGTTYWLRLSGWNGGAGSITLDISCAPLAMEDCADGIDNDGDMLADCDDPDCAMDAACLPPANDDCASATATGEAMGIAVDTSAATTDATPSSCGLPAPDVWVAYTAGCSGLATIETTSGPGGDTILEALDACGGTVLACDDDGGPGFLSVINLTVTSGTTYWLRLSGWNNGAGPITLDISCTAIAANDECMTAEIVAGSGFGTFTTAIDSSGATTGADPGPSIACAASGAFAADVWLSFTPDVTGVLTVDTCDPAGFDTDTLVYSGTCGALVEEACNGDAAPDMACQDFYSSTPGILATAGIEYLIRIGGWGGTDSGPNTVAITMGPVPAEDCANGADDDFDGATDCLDTDCTMDPICMVCPTFLTQNIDPVTIDAAVPACAASAADQTDNSYYRSFDTSTLFCPDGIRVTGVEFGIAFSTSLSGMGQPGAVRLWFDLDGGSPDTGMTLIHEEILTIADGAARLETITLSTPAVFVKDATVVAEVFIADSFFSGTGDVIRLGTNGAGDTVPTYLTGAPCGLVFTPIAGGPIINLIVDDQGGGLNGDSCTFAFPVSEGANPFDTTDFTDSADPTDCTGSTVGGFHNDGWFVYTSPSRGQLIIDTCDPASHDTDLGAYSGSCGALTNIGCNGDVNTPGCQLFDSAVTVSVDEGETIYIRVGGWGPGDEGIGTLNLELIPDLPLFSEIRFDQLGADNDEFIEIAGTVQSLDGLSIIAIGDDAGGSSGVIESVTDLTGGALGSSHFFVVAKSTFSLGMADLTDDMLNLENSDNLTLYLVQGFTGALGDDLDTDDDGTLDSAPWTQVADCVSIIETPGSGDLVYCSTQVGPDGSFPPSQIERCPDEMGVFVIGEADATLLLDTPGAANGCTAPPPNDECSGALTITDGINDIWTASATDSADAAPTGCTNFFGMMLQDAWFTYTASGDGTLTIDTSGSAFDTDAALYDGSCGALNLLACDGDGGGVNFSSLVSAPVTAGTEYILRIGGWGTGEAGDGLLTVSFVAAGDECDNAIPAVDGLNPFDTTPYTNSADASDASQCTGTFLGDLVNDGWWTFVPSIDGTMDVTTVGLTTVDTDLVIYEGACGSLTQLACNGDAGPLQSEVLGLPVTAGTTYTLRIGGWETGEFGTGEFEITVTPIAVAPTASFSISPLQAIAPLEATLIDASDDGMDAGATIEINWGDMTTDSGLAPGSSAMHTYGPGTYTVAVTITNTAGSDTAMSMPIEAVAMGDCDLSGMADVADAVSLAEYLFSGAAAPACDAACDVNGDGVLDLGDVVYMLLWQFAGGTAPVQPAPNSGC